jgi:hypothetical protein
MQIPIVAKVRFIIQEQFRHLELLRKLIEQSANRDQLLVAASDRAEASLVRISEQLDHIASHLAVHSANNTLIMDALTRIFENSKAVLALTRGDELYTTGQAAVDTGNVKLAIQHSHDEVRRLANLITDLSSELRKPALRNDRLQPHLLDDRVATDDKLYFLHIPKTAGTSLRLRLLNTLDVDDYLNCHHLWQLNGISAEKLTAARFYSGHFGLALWDRLPIRPTTITFLREPLAQQLSAFQYLRAARDEEIAQWGTTWSPRSMIELVRQGNPKMILEADVYRSSQTNMQVRFLGGGRTDGAPYTVDAAMFNRACETLKMIAAFGLVERMEESIILIEDKFGWPPSNSVQRFNATAPSADNAFDEMFRAEAAAFSEANAWDVKLYRLAQELFEERLRKLGSKLGILPPKNDRDPDIHRLGKALRKHILMQPPSVRRFVLGRHKASSVFFGEGWDERVEWPPVGRWLRWANPSGLSSILLPLEPHSQPLLFRFEAFFIRNHSIRDALTITIDEKPLPAQRADVMTGDGVYYNVYETVLPPYAADNAPYWAAIGLAIPPIALQTLTSVDASTLDRPFALGNMELLRF